MANQIDLYKDNKLDNISTIKRIITQQLSGGKALT